MRKTCNSFLLTSQFLHVSQVLNFFWFLYEFIEEIKYCLPLTFRMMLGAEKRGTKNLMATRWNVGLRQKKWLKLKTIGPYLAVSSNIETVTIWHTKNRHLNFLWWSAFQVPTTIWRQISQETCVISGYGKSYSLDQTLATQKIRN